MLTWTLVAPRRQLKNLRSMRLIISQSSLAPLHINPRHPYGHGKRWSVRPTGDGYYPAPRSDFPLSSAGRAS